MNEETRSRPIVAIDGPAGAGKSTVARRLADVLGFVLVDTGAMYRAVAVAGRIAGVSWDDARAIGALASSLVEKRALSFERVEGPDSTAAVRVWLEGDDITDAIRAPEVGMGASTVSAYPEVRRALLGLQRNAGRRGGVVLEGRDIGTVVFPDADVKFFLTAHPEVRARRRFDELTAKGATTTFERTLHDVLQRDAQDTNREVAPLRQAPDAILIDSSDLSVDATVAEMADRVRTRSALG